MESHLETKQIKISTVAIQTCWPVGKKRRWRLHSAVSKARDLRNASNWPSRSNWQRKIAIWGFRIIFWPRKTKKAIFWSLFTICLPILDLFGWGGTPKVVEITSKQLKLRREWCLTVCLYQTLILKSHLEIKISTVAILTCWPVEQKRRIQASFCRVKSYRLAEGGKMTL